MFYQYFNYLTVVISVLVVYVAYQLVVFDFVVPEEFYYKTEDFINKYGYESEAHVVESSDGFITTVFRLLPPKSRASDNGPRKDGRGREDNQPIRGPPVLIEGGMFCSSDVMVLKGPGRDLAFILVDNGYDVWLGNYRGTRYSYAGPNANHSDPNLLYFGYHEMGIYDFAVTIDYILERTNHSRVAVAAVSVGSGSLLALLATKPEYNDKISKTLHFGSGLGLKLEGITTKAFFQFLWRFQWLVIKSHMMEPFALRGFLMLLFCERTWLRTICKKAMEDSSGLPDGDNGTMSALTFTLLPSGTPVGIVDHLMQLSLSTEDVFRMRDWGAAENSIRYNSTTPPLYDLSSITVPTRAYYAREDALAKIEIPKKVFSSLPNLGGEITVEPPFCHSNFFIDGGRSPAFVGDVLKTLAT